MKPVAATGVVLLALVGATASRAGGPSSSSYISQYVSLYNQIAQISQSDRGNCLKMGTDLKAWAASNKATLAKLQAEEPQLSSTALAMAALADESQIVSDATKIAGNVLKCASNAQVAAALAAQGKLKKP